jgi:hypothetical protein
MQPGICGLASAVERNEDQILRGDKPGGLSGPTTGMGGNGESETGVGLMNSTTALTVGVEVENAAAGKAV